MVTNKAFTIRLGQTQPWLSSNLAQNWYQYHLNLKLKSFFEKFFGDKFFQNRGVSFSHVLPRFFNSHIKLEVFLHDSKLYDFFSTKPARRALKIFKSKKKVKKFFKKVVAFRRYFRRKQKKRITRIRFTKFKKGKQSRFPVSSTFYRFSSKKFSTPSSNFRTSRQTLESKFKRNKYFKLRFKNVRKFVKLSRKRRKKFFKNKFKFFKPVKLKKSSRSFSNSKLNFLLNRRKHLSSIFMMRRRFKRKKFKKKRRFKKKYSRWRKKFKFKRLFFKKKQFRKKTLLNRVTVKKKYSRRLVKISRKFHSRFSLKLKRNKIKFLKFYLRKLKTTSSEADKFTSSLRAYYFRKKYAIFNNLRNKKILNSRKLRKSRLGKSFFRLYSFRYKRKKSKKSRLSRKRNVFPRGSKLKSFKPMPVYYRKKGQRLPFFKYKKKRRVFRYRPWRVRFFPFNEKGKRASRFIFFNPLSAYASNRFIRYNFYHFLAKFLSAQVFKQFKIPVLVKFNFFPLHRAGSNFYLNFITTKLYYRYILSDVIKPIVRISLKFYRGFVINCNGRFTRAQIAVSKKFVRKSVSYSKVTSSLDYAQRSVVLKYGTCNLRIWIRK